MTEADFKTFQRNKWKVKFHMFSLNIVLHRKAKYHKDGIKSEGAYWILKQKVDGRQRDNKTQQIADHWISSAEYVNIAMKN